MSYDKEFEIEPEKTVVAIFQDGADNLNFEEFQLITDEGDTSNCVEELQLEPKEATSDSDLNHKYSFQSTNRVEEIFQDGVVNLDCEEFQLITDEFGLVDERATSNIDDEMQLEPKKATSCLNQKFSFDSAETVGNTCDDQINFEVTYNQGESANLNNEKTLETNTHNTSDKDVTLGNLNAFCFL